MVLVILDHFRIKSDLLASFAINFLADYLANLRGPLDLYSSGLDPLFGHDLR